MFSLNRATPAFAGIFQLPVARYKYVAFVPYGLQRGLLTLGKGRAIKQLTYIYSAEGDSGFFWAFCKAASSAVSSLIRFSSFSILDC